MKNKAKHITLLGIVMIALASCGTHNNHNHTSSIYSDPTSDTTSGDSFITSSSDSDESKDSSTSSSSSNESTSSNTSSNSSSSSSSSSSNSSSSKSSSSSSNKPSSSSSSSSSKSSSSSSSSSSNPGPEELKPIKPGYTYADYLENSYGIIDGTPSVGTANLLVIPIWFTDSTTWIKKDHRDNVRNDIATAYFGSNEETGWRSVETFYEEESHGALMLNGTVSEWYELNKASTTYRKNYDATTNLVNTAVTWYFANHTDESRKDYDCDRDGYLDGVMLIYGAPDNGSSGDYNAENLWAYCYWVQKSSYKSFSNPGPNQYFWASYDFMYSNGSDASSRTGVTSKAYGGGDTSHCTVDAHTYIHEMGHMFGLEDYYDYSGQYNPAGGFSMQDSNVGGHDPFSIFSLGWGEAYVPTKTTTIKLKPLTESGEMIILSPSWNAYNSPFDEYIVLEYFTPTGLNKLDTTYSYSGQYPKGSGMGGIRVWHVDARLLYIPNNSRTVSADNVTTDVKTTLGDVTLMMSNTYYGNDGQDYITDLGAAYADYNILQQIRNSTSATYKPKDDMSSSSLFLDGDSFSMSKFSKQFVKNGKLNANIDLGFTFTVGSLTSEYATVNITKL